MSKQLLDISQPFERSRPMPRQELAVDQAHPSFRNSELCAELFAMLFRKRKWLGRKQDELSLLEQLRIDFRIAGACGNDVPASGQRQQRGASALHP